MPGKKALSLTGQLGEVMQESAKAAGIRRVILPARNRGDVEKIGEELREGIEFIFVESADEVFKLALTDSAKTSSRTSIE